MLRECIKAKFRKVRLHPLAVSGMFAKALKRKHLRDNVDTLSRDDQFKDQRGYLSQLVVWIDKADKPTLALEHFIGDLDRRYDLRVAPPDCQVSAFDLLGLRKKACLTGGVITAAIATICDHVPGAVTHPVLQHHQTENITKQLNRDIRHSKKKAIFVFCDEDRHHWVAVFVDICASRYAIYNSFGYRHHSTEQACKIMQSVLAKVPVPALESASK